MGTIFLLLCLIGYSAASSCTRDTQVLVERSDITIVNILDQNGEWETIVSNCLDPNIYPNNTNLDIKRQMIQEDGKKKMIVSVSLKGNSNCFSSEALRFYHKGAKNIEVYNDGRAARRMNGMDERGYGGLLTNRPLQDNELFQVRIDKLIETYSTSLGIGISWFDPKNTEYGPWMMCGTKMLYDNQLFESGTVTKEEYGPNLRTLIVGDLLGVMKKSNGDLHFFVNGKDLGAIASGINYCVYGVLDLYGNAVEASLA